MELSQFKTVEQLAAAIKTLDMVTSVAWTDYSGDSTIVGWTSYTTKQIYYKKIGKLVFVMYTIVGESDNASITFTVPFDCAAGVTTAAYHANRRRDDGTYGFGTGKMSPGSAIVIFYTNSAGGSWVNSGDKEIRGQFWYEAA